MPSEPEEREARRSKRSCEDHLGGAGFDWKGDSGGSSAVGLRKRIQTDHRRHPYGIKPLGNLLLSKAAANCRTPGLGALAAFSDELLLTLLADYLAPQDICRLTLASKALYVLGRHDELWRSLVIRRFAPSGTFKYIHTWWETYATCHLAARVGQPTGLTTGAVTDSQTNHVRANHGNSSSDIQSVTRHAPVPVTGFYSDYLYHSHVCATLPLAQYEEGHGENAIDRRSQLSLHDFVEEYEKPGRPVIITDVVCKWPAYTKWDRDYLLANYGDKLFAAEAAQLTLNDYLTYADTQNDEAPLYLFDKQFGERCPGLAEDYEVPVYFRDDLFRYLGDQRPDYRWLVIGPERSGSTFHKDPNATSAWNGVIRGAKKWIMFPPNVLPPGVFTNDDESEVTSPVDIAEWFVNFYKDMRRYWTGRRRPLEGVCRAGELIFVPAGWWHAVINLQFSVAVTQNYVSRWNLTRVLCFLRDKPRQISGLPSSCEGAPGDGDSCLPQDEIISAGSPFSTPFSNCCDIDPEKLGMYTRFILALEKYEPEVCAQARSWTAEEDFLRKAKTNGNAPTMWEKLVDHGGLGFQFLFGHGDKQLLDDDCS